MEKLTGSAKQIHDQTKDFLMYCDENTYTYSRIYSTKKLLRALQTPAYRDISEKIRIGLYALLVNKDIHGSVIPAIDRNNIDEIKRIIKTELESQVAQYIGNRGGNVDPLDIEKIREEREEFIQTEEKEKVEMTNKRHALTQGFGPRPH